MKLKDRENQVLQFINNKDFNNKDLKEHLKKLINSYNKKNQNIFALKDDDSNTLLTLLILYNAHELLNYILKDKDLLDFIKEENLNDHDKKLAESLNNKSFETLSILGDLNKNFRNFVNRINNMKLNKDGEKTLKDLKEHFSPQIEKDKQVLKEDIAINKKIVAERQIEEQEKQAQYENQEEAIKNLLPYDGNEDIDIEKQPLENPQGNSATANYYPITPFDNPKNFQKRIFKPSHYYDPTTSFFKAPHSRYDIDHKDKDYARFMPEGPNFN